ncbi:MAG: hypothetical protein EPO32_04000 [Anaerolineae bacterium]|nr:MAG: hypothetical protein EPO32_04000 [Anaerolineae bacterium]
MKQHEAVILTLERLGGQATLAELYRETMKVEGPVWKTKTPFASIRRIVQTRDEIFKVRPGLWALESHRKHLGLQKTDSARPTRDVIEQNHSYYQGLLAIIGNLRGFSTFIPNQDKNRLCVGKPLHELRSFQTLPDFSHKKLVHRSSSVDVIWSNQRQMPHSFFEIEHSTDFQNSLSKLSDLQDFYTRMVFVSDESKRPEFISKVSMSSFEQIKGRVEFMNYDLLVKEYETEMLKSSAGFRL